jgi:tricorn protease interacting factor F2/3
LEIESYDLDLDVDFPKARLKGTVTMRLRRGDCPLILDAAGFDVHDVQVDGSAAAFKHDSEAGSLTVQGVPLGASSVRVSYSKQISDDVIFGLYKSKYGKNYFLATDLEPNKARTVFPCKDHPAFKAVF